MNKLIACAGLISAMTVLGANHPAIATNDRNKGPGHVAIGPAVKAVCHLIADFLRKFPEASVETKTGDSLVGNGRRCQIVFTGQTNAPGLENELRLHGWKPDLEFSQIVAFGPSGYTAVMVKDDVDCFLTWQTPIESENPDDKSTTSLGTSTYTVNCATKQ